MKWYAEFLCFEAEPPWKIYFNKASAGSDPRNKSFCLEKLNQIKNVLVL